MCAFLNEILVTSDFMAKSWRAFIMFFFFNQRAEFITLIAPNKVKLLVIPYFSLCLFPFIFIQLP